jgi:hypothetical protein
MVANNDTPTPTLIRLADVPGLAWLPKRREGTRLSLSTIHRWAAEGLNGTKLRTLRVGATLCTTEEWLLDFFGALTHEPDATPSRRTPTQRERARERARRELEEAGI